MRIDEIVAMVVLQEGKGVMLLPEAIFQKQMHKTHGL
jgi:hypothetical protein